MDTIKLAFKKDNPNLVFQIYEIERINVAGGIVEYYSGDLIDTSTVPDTRKEFKAQVMAFESEWVDVPVDLGSTGDINNQNKTATPSTSAQTIKPDKGYTGLNKVDIAAVDASIDADIIVGNIKKDVNILGVTGNLESLETVNVNLGLPEWQLNSRLISDKNTTAVKGRPYNNLILWAVGETGGGWAIIPELRMSGEDITGDCLTVETIGNTASTGVGTSKGVLTYIKINIPVVTGDIVLTGADAFNDETAFTVVDSTNLITQ